MGNKMKDVQLEKRVKSDIFKMQEQKRFIEKINNISKLLDEHIKRESRLRWIIGSLLFLWFVNSLFIFMLLLFTY